MKNCTQTMQNHADALRNFASLRENKNMFLCSFVKIIVSQNSTEFAPHGFRKSPRRLRETIHSAWFCIFRIIALIYKKSTD